MSSLYNLEPQPTASCILHTTSGDISLELWAQQVPLTCRNFLQHCLDGYYNDTIFHRLVPGFILQGGDPTGTGAGGESIYDGGAFGESREENGIYPMEDRKGKNAGPQGVGFKDEFHSRLKFNRRGLLGMANEGLDSNGSQFFLTLGDTPELQGKNTLFGRVAGDTIYNVAKMGEAEVEGDRPVYPTKITGVEVLINPFKDMVVRARTAAPIVQQKQSSKPKKRKGGKQLLSFGDDGDGDVEVPALKKTKYDSRIVMDTEDAAPKSPVRPSTKTTEKSVKRTKLVKSSPEPEPAPRARPAQAKEPESRDPSTSPEPVQKVSSLLDRTNAQIAELKASMRRNVETTPVNEKKKSALEEMIPATSIRGRKRGAGGATTSRDERQSLAILDAFRAKLDQAPVSDTSATIPAASTTTETDPTPAPKDDDEEANVCDLHFIANCQSCQSWDAGGKEAENDDDANDTSWMGHALSFVADKLGKDLSYRKKAEEELVVIDPRAKARTLKEEKRAEREARSGQSGRAWDQERNAKMARAAAVAGRAAR